MGEMALDMLDGACCELCGVYFEEEHGHPVVCKSCYDELNEIEKNMYTLATNEEL